MTMIRCLKTSGSERGTRSNRMVVFQNKGLIDLRGITTFGVCVKPETTNPIGYFGTGLKYAIAVCLREGQKVTLWLGTKKCTFRVRKQEIRGEEFHMVTMNHKDLPFTTKLGKDWELWMAYRELAANAMDEPETMIGGGTKVPGNPPTGRTTFIVEGDAIEAIHKQQSKIFLQTEPRYKFDSVELHDRTSEESWIYYRGIRVHKLDKEALYNYNILDETRLTEDRTLASVYTAYHVIAGAIVSCDNAGLIRQMLEAHQLYFESTIDYDLWSARPGKTFNEVVTRYIHTGRSFSTSAKSLYENAHPETPAPALVQWETIPMEKRRKLWAALRFWDKLGIEIPRKDIRVTDALGDRNKGTTHMGTIYLSLHVLDRDMRQVAGIIYGLYARNKHKATELDSISLLIDTIVDFGERLLGLQRKDAV